MDETLPTASYFDQADLEVGFMVLLDLQQELQVYAFDINPIDFKDSDSQMEFIRWNALALISELVEAMNEVGWKPWASSHHINREQFAGEMVDLLHFFANLCLATGISGQMLAEGYVKKRQRNYERQQEGYDGVTGKCPHCNRDYAETHCTPEGYCIDQDGDYTGAYQ